MATEGIDRAVVPASGGLAAGLATSGVVYAVAQGLLGEGV